jgi:hypothetical protein
MNSDQIDLRGNMESLFIPEMIRNRKKDEMPELKIKQIEFESGTWKRLLSFMIYENIYLKKMLSEVLKCRIDKNLLEEIEDFHNRLLKQDEFIGLLRNEIAEFDKLSIAEIINDDKIADEATRKLKNLRHSMMNAEKHFAKLKFEFINFLL